MSYVASPRLHKMRRRVRDRGQERLVLEYDRSGPAHERPWVLRLGRFHVGSYATKLEAIRAMSEVRKGIRRRSSRPPARDCSRRDPAARERAEAAEEYAYATEDPSAFIVAADAWEVAGDMTRSAILRAYDEVMARVGLFEDVDFIRSAIAPFADRTDSDIRSLLQQTRARFERQGGRGIGLAEHIDAMRTALAIRASQRPRKARVYPKRQPTKKRVRRE